MLRVSKIVDHYLRVWADCRDNSPRDSSEQLEDCGQLRFWEARVGRPGADSKRDGAYRTFADRGSDPNSRPVLND